MWDLYFVPFEVAHLSFGVKLTDLPRTGPFSKRAHHACMNIVFIRRTAGSTVATTVWTVAPFLDRLMSGALASGARHTCFVLTLKRL